MGTVCISQRSRTELTLFFCPIHHTYNSAVFHKIIFKTNCTHSLFRTIEARAFHAQQIAKLITAAVLFISGYSICEDFL